METANPFFDTHLNFLFWASFTATFPLFIIVGCHARTDNVKTGTAINYQNSIVWGALFHVGYYVLYHGITCTVRHVLRTVFCVEILPVQSIVCVYVIK